MSTQPTQPEALRLADWLQAAVQIYPQRSEDDPGGYASEVDQVMDEAAAELRRLHALTQGTPATGGEPVACNCKATDMRLGVCCKVRAAFEEWYDQQQDGRIQPFDVWLAAWKGGRKSVGTSPQPVREPLTPGQIEIAAVRASHPFKTIKNVVPFGTELLPYVKSVLAELQILTTHGVTGGQT